MWLFIEGLTDCYRGTSYRPVKSKQVPVHSLKDGDTQLQRRGELYCVRRFESQRTPMPSNEFPGCSGNAYIKGYRDNVASAQKLANLCLGVPIVKTLQVSDLCCGHCRNNDFYFTARSLFYDMRASLSQRRAS